MTESYRGYDYKKLKILNSKDYEYLDALKCFGWKIDEEKNKDTNVYVLKRERNIINKTELLRLEKNLDVCNNDIYKLLKSIHSHASIVSLAVGLIGTIFMTLSTFSIIGKTPNISLCIIFAIPGFICWILPYFIYKMYKKKREKDIYQFIEEKEREIDIICNKAMNLIS